MNDEGCPNALFRYFRVRFKDCLSVGPCARGGYFRRGTIILMVSWRSCVFNLHRGKSPVYYTRAYENERRVCVAVVATREVTLKVEIGILWVCTNKEKNPLSSPACSPRETCCHFFLFLHIFITFPFVVTIILYTAGIPNNSRTRSSFVVYYSPFADSSRGVRVRLQHVHL